jgi:hypothetical protein
VSSAAAPRAAAKSAASHSGIGAAKCITQLTSALLGRERLEVLVDLFLILGRCAIPGARGEPILGDLSLEPL